MSDADRYRIGSWCLAAAGLFLVVQLKLVGALIAGLLVHELVRTAVPALRTIGATHRTGKLIALAGLIAVVGLLVSGVILGLVALLGDGQLNFSALMQQMADVIETARTHFPVWLQQYVPTSSVDIEGAASKWLRAHAGELRSAGGSVGRGLLLLLFGMIIGGLIAFSDAATDDSRGPLSLAIRERAQFLAGAFRRFAFAQVRISALNTLFTALYLAIALPLLGIHLPLVKTMIAVTFIAGLIPIIGNLVSNTVIVIVSLNVSWGVAIGSLVFLVVIHKLEYLLNAQIVGSMVRARAWELLIAMVAMEAAFGLHGLVAAPIYYAYVKDELAARGAI